MKKELTLEMIDVLKQLTEGTKEALVEQVGDSVAYAAIKKPDDEEIKEAVKKYHASLKLMDDIVEVLDSQGKFLTS